MISLNRATCIAYIPPSQFSQNPHFQVSPKFVQMKPGYFMWIRREKDGQTKVRDTFCSCIVNKPKMLINY